MDRGGRAGRGRAEEGDRLIRGIEEGGKEGPERKTEEERNCAREGKKRAHGAWCFQEKKFRSLSERSESKMCSRFVIRNLPPNHVVAISLKQRERERPIIHPLSPAQQTMAFPWSLGKNLCFPLRLMNSEGM